MVRVRQPATRCIRAKAQPKKISHTPFPITDQKPAVRFQVVVRPKGQMTKLANRNEAMPNGIVTISTNASRPAST